MADIRANSTGGELMTEDEVLDRVRQLVAAGEYCDWRTRCPGRTAPGTGARPAHLLVCNHESLLARAYPAIGTEAGSPVFRESCANWRRKTLSNTLTTQGRLGATSLRTLVSIVRTIQPFLVAEA